MNGDEDADRRRRLSLLTVDDHVDVFDIGRGDVVAGLAFVAPGLVPHYTYDVQVLLSVQRVCCREGENEGEMRIKSPEVCSTGT